MESPQADGPRTRGSTFIDREDDQSTAYFHCTNRGMIASPSILGMLPI
jgi:hypothetical protein